MARPHKEGMNYFPFDVDFFNDEKIEFVSAKYGIKGEMVAIRLLCKIYRSGYYTDWNADEAMLLAKRTGDNISQNDVLEIVEELVKRDFFDRKLLEKYSILTSRGIQSRFFEATKRYKVVEVIKEYLLVSPPKSNNVNINSINVDINSNNDSDNTPNRKGKEREKETEIKVNKNDINDRKQKFAQSLSPFVEIFGKETLNEFYAYWTEPNKSNTKFRQELEKTWDTKRRLETWVKNDFSKKEKNSAQKEKPSKFEDTIKIGEQVLKNQLANLK